ncbi:unnamed protein product [Pleuronectes platessa]|uniref:Nephronophthisis 4 n=1 Tax=Pleuronectes platessa TaxID=8262 RepID=A0A9N7U4Q9_PLEPL|nr:unnamed protein product [Pleuronectes platessa]
MVQTEDTATTAEGWREVFERGRLVPPPSHTVRLAAESHLAQSHGFQLSLSRLTAAQPPQSLEMPEAEQDLTYQLRATLYDQNHQHFFGKTWKSSPQKMKNTKISFNEVLYFHTSLRLPSTVVVVELVLLSPRPDSSQQALGRGFTVLELFTNRPEAQAADGNRRLNLHHGSPRVLLHPQLKDTADYRSLLKTIDGTHLDCVVKKHPALVSMMHLLPENVLVSGDENIPWARSFSNRRCSAEASAAQDASLHPEQTDHLPPAVPREV